MAAQLSYAPVAEFIHGTSDYVTAAKQLARELEEKEIPACLIKRSGDGDLESALRACAEFVKKGVLPVVEIYPGDPISALRNLSETCVTGLLTLAWENGEPVFDFSKLEEILNGAGRFRLALDLLLEFNGAIPSFDSYKSLVVQIGTFAKKYSHVQLVKLNVLPVSKPGDDPPDAFPEMLKILAEACPWSKPAVSPVIWVNYSSLRSVASDLGLVPVDITRSEEDGGYRVELNGADSYASGMGLPVLPRLPLIPRYYRKGWYSFEIGKILDKWIDRTTFRAYRDRPGWLED